MYVYALSCECTPRAAHTTNKAPWFSESMQPARVVCAAKSVTRWMHKQALSAVAVRAVD